MSVKQSFVGVYEPETTGSRNITLSEVDGRRPQSGGKDVLICLKRARTQYNSITNNRLPLTGEFQYMHLCINMLMHQEN